MKKYTFKIKRFDPEIDRQPHWEEFVLEMEDSDRILDGLIKIKDDVDGSLTFRRSCAHGICGSCAMKINGQNRLACQTLMKDLSARNKSAHTAGVAVIIEPLPALEVVKDLVVDMEPFFGMNEKVLPYLINNDPPPERERLQDPKDQKKILQAITCIMCGSCTSACPSYWADKKYLGPSALLKAARFIFDTRDRAFDERLRAVTHTHGLWRCHSIYNCVEVCPKEIDITAYISKLKRAALKKSLRLK
ncbi:MAG: succinate dehydrogenase iron-sulfur subunit [Nitrospirae bacterium]|nr:succinate dehydrogenase iron-sulfur subunit [Nitrospirota bacterium]